MKVTLSVDIKALDGTEFEREADYRIAQGYETEWCIAATGYVFKPAHASGPWIVLTPKKPKQWLLTEVATFEEATNNPPGGRSSHYRHKGGYFTQGVKSAEESGYVDSWLKVEEC